MKKICAMLLVLGLLLSMVGCGTKSSVQYGAVVNKGTYFEITPEEFKTLFNEHVGDDSMKIGEFEKEDTQGISVYEYSFDDVNMLRMSVDKSNNMTGLYLINESGIIESEFEDLGDVLLKIFDSTMSYENVVDSMEMEYGMASVEIEQENANIFIALVTPESNENEKWATLVCEPVSKD